MLPEDLKSDFLQFEFAVDVLFNMSYEDILDIFARINTYTVSLNTQEKRNAKYIGYFKQFVYRYGYKYVRYFLDGRILSKRQVARMGEAELSGEVFVALVEGVQTNKNTEQYYRKYEDQIGDLEEASDKFDTIMSYIGSIYPKEEISETNWSRIHLFYTLFTALGHHLFGLNGLKADYRTKITPKHTGKLRVILDDVSIKFDEFTKTSDSSELSKDFVKFIDFSRRRTTDTAARVGRANFICRLIKNKLN